jgi:16S rRNA (cytidine1402-2'-O)-methyltransferase
MKEAKETQIFYESPYRVKETLGAILEVYGNRQIALCRELTKIHEEYLRGTILEILEELKDNPLKGEICLIVSGFLGVVEEKTVWENLSVKEHVEILMQDNDESSKEAIREVAKIRRLKKSEVYAEYHEI